MSNQTAFQKACAPGFVANLKSAEEEWATYNLTNFQMERAKAIRARADFAHWVSAGPIDPTKDGVRRPGKIIMAYYTNDNVLHTDLVGMQKLLRSVSA